jgi:NAD+ kinase
MLLPCCFGDGGVTFDRAAYDLMPLACVASHTQHAQEAAEELAARYDLVEPAEATAIVALGGDGLLLHTMHEHLDLGVPIFGMNRGTAGFLMNEYRAEGLPERVQAATCITVHPLAMTARDGDGRELSALAFNEVTVRRETGQAANVRISVDGVERIARFSGDGLIVATPQGSTAYNRSANGPIIPLGADLLAITAVSPGHPRRWRGALVPSSSEVVIENLDPAKRPLAATADSAELPGAVRVTVARDASTSVRLLFDADRSLEERIIAEQFAS